jgi:hypothetical protein
VNLQRVDPGFDPRRVLTARISLPEAAYAEPPEMLRFWDEALRSVRELPGVEEAGLTTSLPPDNGGDTNNFDLVERPVAPGESEPAVPWAWVTPELFGRLGVPLVDGRMLERRDDSPDRPVVVVSRSWARRYFPGESAVGKRMYVGGCRECVPSTVVGVVGDVKYAGLAAGAESVYEPMRQNPGATLSLVVRASVSPGGAGRADPAADPRGGCGRAGARLRHDGRAALHLHRHPPRAWRGCWVPLPRRRW